MPLKWSNWRLFADPRQRGILIAPLAPAAMSFATANNWFSMDKVVTWLTA